MGGVFSRVIEVQADLKRWFIAGITPALLTARRIQQDGCSLEGWIANCMDPDMPEYANNLKTLENLLPVPLLGEVPWQGKLSAIWQK